MYKLYQSVIDDVVNGIRDAFLDEGIDEEVLNELRILWESKLVSTKAVDSTPENSGQGATGGSTASTSPKETNGHNEKASNSAHLAHSAPAPKPQPAQQQQQQSPLLVLPTDPNTLVPIQITMPRLSSDPPGFQRQITIHVPASCIHSNKLQDILSLPAIQATLSLPTEMAAAALQGQINQALQNVDMKATPQSSLNQGFVQVDGQAAGGDSSDDEDEDDDDDDDLDDDADDRDEEREEEAEEEGQDEEPLNSDDDVSDPEGSSERLYDIENVVVCQFDKITRTRNKWKFHLKDGIMNLNGKDYAFQKATGDAEW